MITVMTNPSFRMTPLRWATVAVFLSWRNVVWNLSHYFSLFEFQITKLIKVYACLPLWHVPAIQNCEGPQLHSSPSSSANSPLQYLSRVLIPPPQFWLHVDQSPHIQLAISMLRYQENTITKKLKLYNNISLIRSIVIYVDWHIILWNLPFALVK